MAVTKCKEGHFYDSEKFSECPHCKEPLKKRRVISDEMTQFQYTPPATNSGRRNINLGSASVGDEKTVGIYRSNMGVDPVVGWFVCIKGSEKGRSYILHAGRNYIGRDLKMDISIPDDESITREDHCSLVFEPKSVVFVLVRGLGETLLVNGENVENSYTLKGDEHISLGNSEFIFVPFCKEGRVWD